MPPSATNDSFSNGLRKILGDVAQLSTVPDADLAFCTQLQTEIVAHLRQGLQQAFNGMMTPNLQPAPLPGVAGGPGPMDMPPDMAMAGPGGPPPGTMTGGASPGLSPGMPAVDELARLLHNKGNAQ